MDAGGVPGAWFCDVCVCESMSMSGFGNWGCGELHVIRVSGGIICKMYKSYMTLYANMSMPIQAVQGIEGNEEHAAHPS